MKWVFILLVGILLVSGCTQQGGEPPVSEQAKSECIELCKGLSRLLELSDGPCLSDTQGGGNWIIEDWVCDVAHDPREPVDNLPENQCQEFREGKAHHFVEVDPSCEFIKAV
ncbi:MAG: hypothetical protein V3U72_03415 [Candidatus Aenigmarchaeota archaeon]